MRILNIIVTFVFLKMPLDKLIHVNFFEDSFEGETVISLEGDYSHAVLSSSGLVDDWD